MATDTAAQRPRWDTRPEQCRLNNCTRPQGAGTWTLVVVDGTGYNVPVCEKHWMALKVVLPV